MLRAAARCSVSGCQNFGNPSRDGKCNGCFSGKPPAIDAGRVAEEAAVLAATDPDDAATVAAKLARSLAMARQFDADCPADKRRHGCVPFILQRKPAHHEQIFHVRDRVYVGSEYAAADVGLLRGLGISRVINISSGSRTVPNYGELVPAWAGEVAYKHYPLEDRVGFPVDAVSAAMREGVPLIEQWSAVEGRGVLVHCSAGLCRSASMVMAWLMLGSAQMTLGEAVAAFTAARGRPPVCSPSFWSALVAVEKSLPPRRVSAAAAAPAAAGDADASAAAAAVGGAGATAVAAVVPSVPSPLSSSTSTTDDPTGRTTASTAAPAAVASVIDASAVAPTAAAAAAGAAPARAHHRPYTPTYDFSHAVCDDLGAEAGPTSLQLAPDAEVARLLVELGWDADAVFRHLVP